MIQATESETQGQPPSNPPAPGWPPSPAPDRPTQQPLQTIQKIQPHGLLLAVSEPDFLVRQASANVFTLLELAPEAVLGNPLESLLGPKQFHLLQQLIQLDHPPASPLPMQVGGRALEVKCFVHRSDGMLIVELELLQGMHGPSPLAPTSQLDQPSANTGPESILIHAAQTAASEIRRLTGFQRVMVGRFDENCNGDIIAESADASATSYLGSRFPASDVPDEVLRRSTLNRLPTIVDVDATPVALVPETNPLTGRPLDLTFSLLRCNPPAHLEYLRKLGIKSSMLVPIIIENRVWGMIVCHHNQPLHLDYATRSFCDLVGKMLASQLGLRLENSALQARLASTNLLHQCTKSVNETRSLHYPDYLDAARLLELFDADELVLHLNGVLSAVRNTIKPSCLLPLLPQLRALSSNGIASSNSLSTLDPGVASYASNASGALYIGLSEDTGDYLLLLRRELVETVNWVGHSGQQAVHGRSRRWTTLDLENARLLRDRLIRLQQDLAALSVSKDRLVSESEQRFRSLADAMPQIVWTARPDGRVDYYNRRWYSYTGRDPAGWNEVNWTESIHPDDLRQSLDSYASSLVTGRPYEAEYRLKRGSDGAYRWHLGRAYPLRNDKQEIALWVGTCTDIEDQKQTLSQLELAVSRRTAELNAAQKQLQTILDGATNVSIIATDSQGLITVFNTGAQNLLGYTAQEVVGKCTPALIHLESETIARGVELSHEMGQEVRAFDVFVARARKGQPEERDWTYVRKDGSHLAVTLVVTALKDSDGTITGFLGVAMDVSARKRAEAAAKASDERFRQIVEAVEDYALIMLDPAGNVVSWNIGAERINGYQAHEIIGRHSSCFYLPKDIEDGVPARNLLAAEQGRYSEEGWRVRKDGSAFFAEVFLSAIRDDAGKLLGFAKVVHDITERKQIDERFQVVVEAAPSAMIMVGTNGRIGLVNVQTEKLFGFERHQLLGQPVEMLLPERFRLNCRNFIDTFFAAPSMRKIGESKELYGLRQDGSQIPVEVGLNPISTSQGQFFLASIVDITERQSHQRQMLEHNTRLEAANQELNVSLRRLGLAIDALGAGLFDWQLPTGEIVWDARMREIYGVPPRVTATFGLWASAVLPEDLPACEAKLQHIIASKSQGGFMFRIRRSDGALRFIHSAVGPILNESGEVVRLTGINIDTTDRKFNEDLERQVEVRTAELKAANKELQEFAYVASHDLKAPLRVIDNASKWLEEDLEEHLTGESRENIALLRGRVKRMEKLLDDLLEYARIGRSTDNRYAETVNGHVLMDDVLSLLSSSSHSIKVSPEFERIQVCRMPLQGIFMNLIGNAIKHHDKQAGNIEVSVEDHPQHYLFAVKDDGPGIEPRFHEQIFKMFQTLRPRDQVEGSGMGLAMVRKNLEVFGGTLQLESAVGAGSTFRFTWPKQQRLNNSPNSQSMLDEPFSDALPAILGNEVQ
jgi:PAS domain S-box-containing protein